MTEILSSALFKDYKHNFIKQFTHKKYSELLTTEETVPFIGFLYKFTELNKYNISKIITITKSPIKTNKINNLLITKIDGHIFSNLMSCFEATITYLKSDLSPNIKIFLNVAFIGNISFQQKEQLKSISHNDAFELSYTEIEDSILPVYSYEWASPPLYSFKPLSEKSLTNLENGTKLIAELTNYLGTPNVVYSFGSNSGALSEALNTQLVNVKNANSSSGCYTDKLMEIYMQNQKTVDRLIIFDRLSDMYTPSLYEKNYEGLLSEVFKLQNNCVNGSLKPYLSFQDPFETSLKNRLNMADVKDAKTGNFIVAEDDTFYNGICTKEIYEVGDIFKTKATRIEEEYKKLNEKNDSKMETKQMMEIVKKTKELKSEEANLNSHFKFTEKIVGKFLENKFVIEKNSFDFLCLNKSSRKKCIAFIEKIIEIKHVEYKYEILRCLVLFCLSFNGFYEKELNNIFDKILLSCEEELTKLTNCGVIYIYGSNKSNYYKNIIYKLGLKINEPKDKLEKVYNGYIPLITHIVNTLLRTKNTDDLLVSLNNALIMSKRTTPFMTEIERRYKNKIQGEGLVDVIVCVGGGLTMSEKRCIQILYEKQNKKYIVVGNGGTIDELFK
eukprot:GAHX01000773.1.p1 GENE.GAHX01000773.1~~GAHX01000773.1.p1  ORF type:complete len:626 (-),score=162.54 GAHX01000773.1:738-2576(-)